MYLRVLYSDFSGHLLPPQHVWYSMRCVGGFVCLFVCFHITSEYLGHFYNRLLFCMFFSYLISKEIEVFGNIPGWLMRGGVGVFVSLEQNIL